MHRDRRFQKLEDDAILEPRRNKSIPAKLPKERHVTPIT